MTAHPLVARLREIANSDKPALNYAVATALYDIADDLAALLDSDSLRTTERARKVIDATEPTGSDLRCEIEHGVPAKLRTSL